VNHNFHFCFHALLLLLFAPTLLGLFLSLPTSTDNLQLEFFEMLDLSITEDKHKSSSEVIYLASSVEFSFPLLARSVGRGY